MFLEKRQAGFGCGSHCADGVIRLNCIRASEIGPERFELFGWRLHFRGAICLEARCVPEQNCRIVASRGQKFAVRGKSERGNRTLMTPQRSKFLLGKYVPKTHARPLWLSLLQNIDTSIPPDMGVGVGFVTSSGQQSSIRGKCQVSDTLISLECQPLAAGSDFPHSNLPILQAVSGKLRAPATGGQHAAIRRENDT